jgi:hypothetical protein
VESLQPIPIAELPKPAPAITAAPAPAPALPVATAPETTVKPSETSATNGAVTAATTTNLITTNVVVAAQPPKPTPITYKLQGIFYRPGSSSAVINGKTVFPGSHVGDAVVLAIGPGLAKILTASGETNVLELAY